MKKPKQLTPEQRKAAREYARKWKVPMVVYWDPDSFVIHHCPKDYWPTLKRKEKIPDSDIIEIVEVQKKGSVS